VDLQTSLNKLRAGLEERLSAETTFRAACPSLLAESIRYSLLAPGKRVRPCLVLMACEACSGSETKAWPAAVALEMIHCYSLIHDDLPAMDNDDLRRGRPTNHIQFGESTAILAGDGLLTLAFEILARDLRPAELALACITDLADAAGICGMVGGQQMDLDAETAAEVSLEQLEAIHGKKTGRLLCAALRMGGRIGGADTETLANLNIYGESVGLAFQIADDLLDVLGQQDKMGKGVGKDAALGKLTYPALLGVDESRRRAQRLIDRACAAVAPLGERSTPLMALARYVIERDH
jgi:geranylgeranyl diphosphate synthase type II